jgi:hypothetical protein
MYAKYTHHQPSAVNCDVLHTVAQHIQPHPKAVAAEEASSALQRYIPAEVPDGFTLHRLDQEDDQPAAEGYTMYFSSTTGWFSGTADLNAARTSVYILPNETDDPKYIADYIAGGGKPVTVHGNLGAMGVSGGYGSVRLITPTGFVVVNAFSPKMSSAYILPIATSLKADYRVNKPAYKMPTPKVTKTKFAGLLAGKYSKSWRYWMSKNAQEVVFYSSATTGIELESRLSAIGLPVHQVTVHGSGRPQQNSGLSRLQWFNLDRVSISESPKHHHRHWHRDCWYQQCGA